MESTRVEIPTSNCLFHNRNLDARLPLGPRDLAPLLLRLARAWLNVGSGLAGPVYLANYIRAVA
jgi:hypothetical protein